MEPLNNVDVVILICVALSMLVAFVRGFVKEILSIVGLILFALLIVYTSPFLIDIIKPHVQSMVLTKVIVFLSIMAVFYGLWIVCTDKLIAHIRTSSLSFMDRLFGLVFGFLRAIIILSFCFLVVKIVLPEELEKGALKESKYFMMTEGCSDVLENLIPEDKIKNTLKSVEDVNKVEKDKNTSKDGDKEDNKTKEVEEENKDIPSKKDQEQMNKMFELLVKPEIKKIAKEQVNSDEKTGYDAKDTSGLDALIDKANN
jgi:membrane protein required for colicin V production